MSLETGRIVADGESKFIFRRGEVDARLTFLSLYSLYSLLSFPSQSSLPIPDSGHPRSSLLSSLSSGESSILFDVETRSRSDQKALLCSFLCDSGLIVFAIGILRLGWLVEFIPTPAVAGKLSPPSEAPAIAGGPSFETRRRRRRPASISLFFLPLSPRADLLFYPVCNFVGFMTGSAVRSSLPFQRFENDAS